MSSVGDKSPNEKCKEIIKSLLINKVTKIKKEFHSFLNQLANKRPRYPFQRRDERKLKFIKNSCVRIIARLKDGTLFDINNFKEKGIYYTELMFVLDCLEDHLEIDSDELEEFERESVLNFVFFCDSEYEDLIDKLCSFGN